MKKSPQDRILYQLKGKNKSKNIPELNYKREEKIKIFSVIYLKKA